MRARQRRFEAAADAIARATDAGDDKGAFAAVPVAATAAEAAPFAAAAITAATATATAAEPEPAAAAAAAIASRDILVAYQRDWRRVAG